MSIPRTICALFVIFMVSPAPRLGWAGADARPAGTGFEGRIILGDQVLEGARVYAYRSFADLLALRPAYVSSPSLDTGAFLLDLPPGIWFLTAKKRAKGEGDGPLASGDAFAYHGSNPISVTAGAYTHVGFSAVRKEGETILKNGDDPATGSISGKILYQGQPLDGAIVSLYLDAAEDFRGQVHASAPPTGKSGLFRLDLLPPGSYFLIARKRARKAGAGPLEDGDFFGYFLDNPVAVTGGMTAHVTFPVGSKSREIGKEDSLFRESATRISGRITAPDGKPLSGVYAFAYREKEMGHKRPAFISRETDAQGTYTLHLTAAGTYYIGARSGYGEGPAPGDWYGKYAGSADHEVRIKTGDKLEGIDIRVERSKP